jgi:uncharacterized membrane protein YcaP (DUF421 family)
VEIVIRATVMFAFLWLVTRAVGKRELGQLSAFELVLLVTMGDLVQQSITQEDYSVTGGMLTIGTFALLSVLLSWVSWRFPRSRPVLEGRPAVVVRDGQPQEEVLAAERMTRSELMEAARKQGVRSLGEVDLAVLENDGSISFFRHEANSDH